MQNFFLYVLHGTHYVIAPEDDPDPFRGFAGARFQIEFNDGTRVVTTNLWCQGEPNEHWKDKFPNNARFENDVNKASLFQANSLLDMRKAGTGSYKILNNGPVYRLNSPTFHVPTKSTAFNPTIIDSSGKMHIDWSNPNIYKTLFPFGLD